MPAGSSASTTSGVTGEVAGGLDRPFSASVDAAGTLWVSCADALVGLRDGAVQTRIDALAGAQGIAAGAAGVVAVHPPSNRIVAVEPASGAIRPWSSGPRSRRPYRRPSCRSPPPA